MAENSKIAWTDHTFNPWIGCSKVSPGCANCYAEELDRNRFSKLLGGASKENPVSHWGKGAPRVRTSAANWRLPLKWNKQASIPTVINYGQTDDLGQPAKAFYRPRVFCASLADWLDDEVPIEWLADLLKLIHETPNLNWLLLTKRPQNWRDRIAAAMVKMDEGLPYPSSEQLHEIVEASKNRESVRCVELAARFARSDTSMMLGRWLGGCAPHNVWLGTTVEDQARADERIPILTSIPARVRFLSVEPMLEQIDLGLECDLVWKCPSCHQESGPIEHHYINDFSRFECLKCGEITDHGQEFNSESAIHWVIFGGESGCNSRLCNIGWIRDGLAQCRLLGIAPFVKQLGSNPRHSITGQDMPGGCPVRVINSPIKLRDKKGGAPSEWPEDLRVREFPEVGR